MKTKGWDIPYSRLGFGCYALGGAYGNRLDAGSAEKLIHLAFDSGLRIFDTAQEYACEEVLGRAVRPFRREIAIATKAGAASQGRFALDRKQLLASCENSLFKLNTDYLDIFQVHYDDPHTPVQDVVDTLELLRSQGKIRHYGVGHLPLNKTRTYLELGQPLTVLAEMNAAALNRYRELRPLQERNDFHIIAFSVTGRGLLTGNIRPDQQFSQGDIRSIDPLFKRKKLVSGLRIKDQLEMVGKRYDATPGQMAIAWVLSKPGVSIALTGPTNPVHLMENCRALNIHPSSECLEEVNQCVRQEEEVLQAEISLEIQEILNGPLYLDPDKAADDLIYVLEHAVEGGLIPYQPGVELFMELMKHKKSPVDSDQIHACREKARLLMEQGN